MGKGIYLAGGIIVLFGAGIAWFLFSPLLFDEVIDESFPTSEQVASMSATQKSAAMNTVMSKMATMPDTSVDETMPMAPSQGVPQVQRIGAFSGADALHSGQGQVTQYALPSGDSLVRFESFVVTNGPALVVYLTEHPQPSSAAEVLEGFHSLGALKGNKGNQNYSVGPNVDLSQYGSVVVWCELFDVLFAVAPLEPI